MNFDTFIENAEPYAAGAALIGTPLMFLGPIGGEQQGKHYNSHQF